MSSQSMGPTDSAVEANLPPLVTCFVLVVLVVHKCVALSQLLCDLRTYGKWASE
jgi:hypothetical protein